MIRNAHSLTRRRFFQASAAAAACGLATTSSAAAAANSPLIDTHVYIGHWPLASTAADSPSELAALLRRAGVTQAWAGSFDGLFHKDIHGVNARLTEICRMVGSGLLVPLGTVNPTLPDWDEDIRRCHESFKMRGVRLHPAYHGYTLDDPRFAQLLKLATERGLFVQLVVQLPSGQQRLLTPRIPQVDLSPLADIVEQIRGPRVLILQSATSPTNVAQLARRATNLVFDTACATDGSGLRTLIDAATPHRVVFGSGAPLPDCAAALNRLDEANPTANDAALIRGSNARQLMSGAK